MDLTGLIKKTSGVWQIIKPRTWMIESWKLFWSKLWNFPANMKLLCLIMMILTWDKIVVVIIGCAGCWFHLGQLSKMRTFTCKFHINSLKINAHLLYYSKSHSAHFKTVISREDCFQTKINIVKHFSDTTKANNDKLK